MFIAFRTVIPFYILLGHLSLKTLCYLNTRVQKLCAGFAICFRGGHQVLIDSLFVSGLSAFCCAVLLATMQFIYFYHVRIFIIPLTFLFLRKAFGIAPTDDVICWFWESLFYWGSDRPDVYLFEYAWSVFLLFGGSLAFPSQRFFLSILRVKVKKNFFIINFHIHDGILNRTILKYCITLLNIFLFLLVSSRSHSI